MAARQHRPRIHRFTLAHPPRWLADGQAGGGSESRRAELCLADWPSAKTLPKILANLRFLDAAVLLALWDEWQLTELLDEVLPKGSADVAPALVLAALTIQRGVDPGSKLYATRWFPTSALPELLGVCPSAFNNTRVHRVLDELDAAGTVVMGKLPARYQDHDGAFVSLLLDTTDTWFVGHGPELAECAKTKEGRDIAAELEPIAQSDALAKVMQLARSIEEAVAAGRYSSKASASRALVVNSSQ